MSSEIVAATTTTTTGGLPELAQELARKAEGCAAASKAANTRKAYKSDWAAFEGWCRMHALAPMPADPNVVLANLVDRAGRLKVSTLQRHLSSTCQGCGGAGFALDTTGAAFRHVWRGIRRKNGIPNIADPSFAKHE